MIRYVIDANVAIKWYFEETLWTDAIRYLQSQAHLISPDFIKVEFANVIVKKVRIGDVNSDQGWSCYQNLFQSNVLEFIPTEDLLGSAYKLANSIEHSIYDCIYLAAARRIDASVVTADRKFYECVQKHDENKQFVRWIEQKPE